MINEEKEIEIIEGKKISRKDSRKMIIGFICIAVAIVAIVLIILLVFNSPKKQLTRELEKTGRNFYENFYYDQAGKDENERKTNLSKFTSAGIKVDLENLIRSTDNKDELSNKFVNNKTKEKCNETNTKVTIYPKDPYGKKDYTISVNLDCGFDK